MRYFILLLGLATFLLSACTAPLPAPVTEGWRQPASVQGAYKVQPGDTLYSIAWRFANDYRELAAINGIEPPYALRVGQSIYLTRGGRAKSPAPTKVKTPVKPRRAVVTAKQVKVAKAHAAQSARRQGLGPVRRWYWPTQGPLLKAYGGNNKGIDIGGKRGQTIRATAGGRVVYAGHGIRGYGNLIIIKHNAEFLSAYAHNQQIFVRENQSVKAGQRIASMGSTGANRVFLHFEIRRAGQPINPLPRLKKR